MDPQSRQPPSQSPRPLTRRQRAILAFCVRYIATERVSPTVREIMAGCQITSTAPVTYNLDVLEARGLLLRHRHQARGIAIPAGPNPPDWERQRVAAIKDFEIIAHMVHNAYHPDKTITWRTCELASCTRARDAIAALGGTVA